MVAYFGLLRLLEFPTFVSTFAYSQISLGISSARRILDLINRETNLDQNAQGYADAMKGEVEFQERESSLYTLRADWMASTHTSAKEDVFQNISFKVKPGQTVAIVGQTGAGKTSLVKLINRTYDIIPGTSPCGWSGCARLESGGAAFTNLDDRTGYLSVLAFGQREHRFRKTGMQLKVRSKLAAKSAQADDFIQTFDKGYATVVGERGVTLSGGQRQRIALARAFLTDPHILILDDSTSAIDSATEDKIQRAISNAARGRTTFIITHRLSQIRWADLIIVLRKGRIAAIGTHEELMKTSEAYSRIFREYR